MNFEIQNNKCEICGQQATFGMNDITMVIHYSCFDHINDVYKKHNVNAVQNNLQKERAKTIEEAAETIKKPESNIQHKYDFSSKIKRMNKSKKL